MFIVIVKVMDFVKIFFFFVVLRGFNCNYKLENLIFFFKFLEEGQVLIVVDR